MVLLLTSREKEREREEGKKNERAVGDGARSVSVSTVKLAKTVGLGLRNATRREGSRAWWRGRGKAQSTCRGFRDVAPA